MIGSAISEYRSYSVFFGTARTDGADGSFDEALAEAATDILKNAPDQWVTEAGFSSHAIKKALEYMKNELGINADEIEPTHELTPEQTDWLKSRYDFSTMRHYVRYTFVNESGITQYAAKSTVEYSNFVADLTYLGVFTEKELNEMWLEPIDIRSGCQPILSDCLNETERSDLLSDTVKMFVAHLERMFGLYDERSKDTVRAADGDAEFAALIGERLLSFQLFAGIIERLTGGDDEEFPQSGAVPPIEDASGKLDEDFAGLRQKA